MWKCSKCGAENGDEYIFCFNCSARRDGGEEPESQPEKSTWKCTCGWENEERFSYCAKCGKQRNGNSQPSGWKCSKCGTQNNDEAQFCSKCGAGRGQSGELPKPLIIGIAAVVAVAAIVAIVVAASKKSETKSEPTPTPVVQYVTVYATPEPTPYVQPAPVYTATPTLVPSHTQAPAPQGRVISTDIPSSARDWRNHYFKQWKINYNVFTTGEVTDCFAVHIDYSCSLRNKDSGKSVTGTRIVYARDYENEIANNDNAWIEVGRFEYNKTNGEAISVDLNWDSTLGPIDIYSMAIDRDDKDAGTSYNSSWGSVVTLYSYVY